MSTHLMYQVEAMCNRIVLIDKGRTVLYGEVDKIKRDFATNAILVEGQGDFTRPARRAGCAAGEQPLAPVAGAGRRAADGLPRAGWPRRGEDRALRAGRAVAGRHLHRGGAAAEGQARPASAALAAGSPGRGRRAMRKLLLIAKSEYLRLVSGARSLLATLGMPVFIGVVMAVSILLTARSTGATIGAFGLVDRRRLLGDVLPTQRGLTPPPCTDIPE